MIFEKFATIEHSHGHIAYITDIFSHSPTPYWTKIKQETYLLIEHRENTKWKINKLWASVWIIVDLSYTTQQTFACSNSTKETLEKGVEYVQGWQKRWRRSGFFSVNSKHISDLFLVFAWRRKKWRRKKRL